MSEFQPPGPQAQAKPFAPERPVGGGGCQKPLLVGCGLLSLLLGIAAVVFVVKAKDVLAYAMNQLRAEVVAHLPEDASDSDRQRVEAGFDAALARIRSGELDPAALQDLQKKLTGAASAAGKRRLSGEEMNGLLAALDRFNQVAEEPAEELPAGPEAASGGQRDDAGSLAEPGSATSADPPADAPRPPAP